MRARFGWLDHVIRAYERFDERHGSFFAAGLAYYTIFALFPLLMVGFAAVGFALSRRPELLNTIDDHVRSAVSSSLGQQLVDLMNSAIRARASVGIIGLATAAWAGMGWMSRLRTALTEMWWEQPLDSPGFVRNKLSDLLAILWTFLVMVATLGLSALGHTGPMRAVLRWLGIPEFSVFDAIFRVLSIVVSMLVAWVLFTWMIVRLPREQVSPGGLDAGRFDRGGRLRTVQAGGIDLFAGGAAQPGGRHVRAGVGFDGIRLYHRVSGAVLRRLGRDGGGKSRAKPVAPPAPAIISPRVQLDEGISARQTLAAMAVGAVGALAFSRFTNWRR